MNTLWTGQLQIGIFLWHLIRAAIVEYRQKGAEEMTGLETGLRRIKFWEISAVEEKEEYI